MSRYEDDLDLSKQRVLENNKTARQVMIEEQSEEMWRAARLAAQEAREAWEFIRENADFWDEGPAGEGWRSDRMAKAQRTLDEFFSKKVEK